MEADIVEGNIGSAGAYDVEFKGGKLVAKASYAHELVKGTMMLEVPAEAVLVAIKKAIPGEMDDAVINFLQKALLESK